MIDEIQSSPSPQAGPSGRVPELHWRGKKKNKKTRTKKVISPFSPFKVSICLFHLFLRFPPSSPSRSASLAGGAVGAGVWRVLLIYCVQEYTHRLPGQVVVAVFAVLLLRGIKKPFLLVAVRAAAAAVTEVQGPVQSIIDEPVKLLEVIVVMAPVAYADFDARVAREAALPARRLVLGVGNGAALLQALRAVTFQQFLLALCILLGTGPLHQLCSCAGAAGLHALHFGYCSLDQRGGGRLGVSEAGGPGAVSTAVIAAGHRRAALCWLQVSRRVWDCATAACWDTLLM